MCKMRNRSYYGPYDVSMVRPYQKTSSPEESYGSAANNVWGDIDWKHATYTKIYKTKIWSNKQLKTHDNNFFHQKHRQIYNIWCVGIYRHFQPIFSYIATSKLVEDEKVR